MSHYKGLIARLGVFGYDHPQNNIEPIIVTCWALGWPIRLVGLHGTAKTYLAELLSAAENGKRTSRLFDAPTENLITLFGMPSIEALKQGRIDFIHSAEGAETAETLWTAKNQIFNEFTRMSADNQNYLLTALQERRAFGKPLPTARKSDPEEIDYSIIATENPEGIGVKRVDVALLDRFYCVVNVPDNQKPMGADRKRIVGANFLMIQRNEDGTDPLIQAFARDIREEYKRLAWDASYLSPVIDYGAQVWELFPQDVNYQVYISPRRQALLTEVVLGIAAYQSVVEGKISLREAAREALKYSVVLPLKLTPQHTQILMRVHDRSADLVFKASLSPKEQFSAELELRPNLRDKVRFLQERLTDFVNLYDISEREMAVGKLMRDANDENILGLHNIITRVGGHEELLRKCEIRIVATVSERIERIRASIGQRQFMTYEEMGIAGTYTKFISLLQRHPMTLDVARMLLEPTRDKLDFTLEEAVRMLQKQEKVAA